jgi:hypothetical protein
VADHKSVGARLACDEAISYGKKPPDDFIHKKHWQYLPLICATSPIH